LSVFSYDGLFDHSSFLKPCGNARGFFRDRNYLRIRTSYGWDTCEETAMLQTTPKQELQTHHNEGFIRTFDPDVPGYVFWLVMLAIIAFHQLVLHVR
jgi:hypothetical protein